MKQTIDFGKLIDLNQLSLSEKLGNENGIVVTKKEIFNKPKLDEICKNSDKNNIVLKLGSKEDEASLFNGLLSKREGQKLFAVKDYIHRKYGKNLFIYGGYSISSVAKISYVFAELAEEINELTIDGRLLSPIEKCICIHRLASRNRYKVSKSPADSKTIYGGMLNGYVDCVGCASFMVELLKLCGIPAVTETMLIPEKDGFSYDDSFHRVCRVLILDPIYKIRGGYICDPTFDIGENATSNTMDYVLMTQKDYSKSTQAQNDASTGDNCRLFNCYREVCRQRGYEKHGVMVIERLNNEQRVISKDIKRMALSNVKKAIDISKENESEIKGL